MCWWELCLRAITAANGCIRVELLREVELYSGGRSTTDGIQVILRNRISWSAVQPASTRFGHFHDCCRRSCFANSPSGWEAIQDDRRGGFCEKHPFPGVVLYCPHLWSHSFAPDLPSPHVWLLPGGKSALTLLCRILLLPGRQIS